MVKLGTRFLGEQHEELHHQEAMVRPFGPACIVLLLIGECWNSASALYAWHVA